MITAEEARKLAEFARANKFESSELGRSISSAIHKESLYGGRSTSYRFPDYEDVQEAKDALEELGFNVLCVVKSPNDITLNISW